MALVKYWPILKMYINIYRLMLTGVWLQAHADSMKLAETIFKII